MANSLNDGLSKPDQLDNSAIQSIEIGSGAVMAANISGGQINKTHLAYGQIGTGSPTSYGLSIQTGVDVTSASSGATVVFGTAFKGTPYVVASASGTNAVAITTLNANAGSFDVISEGANVAFNWIAIGSGTI